VMMERGDFEKRCRKIVAHAPMEETDD